MLFNFIWIFGIVGFSIVFFYKLEEEGRFFDFLDFMFSLAIGCFTSIASTVATFIMAIIISANANTEYVQTYQSQIYANTNNSYCVIESGSGKYKVYIDETNANSIRVYESKTELLDDGGTSIESYQKVYSNEAVTKFIGNFSVGDVKWIIHTPKNSISTEKVENK